MYGVRRKVGSINRRLVFVIITTSSHHDTCSKDTVFISWCAKTEGKNPTSVVRAKCTNEYPYITTISGDKKPLRMSQIHTHHSIQVVQVPVCYHKISNYTYRWLLIIDSVLSPRNEMLSKTVAKHTKLIKDRWMLFVYLSNWRAHQIWECLWMNQSKVESVWSRHTTVKS